MGDDVTTNMSSLYTVTGDMKSALGPADIRNLAENRLNMQFEYDLSEQTARLLVSNIFICAVLTLTLH